MMNSRSDSSADSLANQIASQNQPRPSSGMNSYAPPNPLRQPSRLQNSRSTGLGSGNAGAGWAFGAPASFGGLGGAPGLGQGRPGQLSGFAQVMGGGSGQTPIDMRDFPSLGGAPQSNPAPGGWNSSAIRQSSAQQQPSSQAPGQQHQPRAPSTAPSHQSLDQYESQRSQQQQQADRGGGGDEFPPLSGLPSGSNMGQTNGFGSSLGSPTDSHPHLNGHQSQLPIRDGPAFSPSSQNQIGSGQHPGSDAPSNQPMSSGAPVKKWADMTEQERFGMAGLAARLQAKLNYSHGLPVDETLPSQEFSAALLLAQDLNTIGMDLDSPDPIYSTFHPFPNSDGSGSIFDIRDRQPVPAFSLSESYTVNNVPPLRSRMNSLSDETLLQIFYQYPRSVEQELAAQELSNREWRWHKVLRQWLQKDTRETNSSSSISLIDHTNGAPIGTPPMRIDAHTDRGIYIFLDAPNWRRERREFTLDYDLLDNRVPMPSAASALAAAAGQTSGPLPSLPTPGFVNNSPGVNQLFNSSSMNWNPAAGGGLGAAGGERQQPVNTGA